MSFRRGLLFATAGAFRPGMLQSASAFPRFADPAMNDPICKQPGETGSPASSGRRILFGAAALLLLFLAHLAADWFMAARHPEFFLHDDGNEYLAGVRSFAEDGTIMAGEERYYEAPRTRDIPEAFRPPLPAFLAGLLARVLRDPMAAAAVFTALSATLLAWAVFLAGQRLGGTWGGLAAAVIVTFHPLFLTFSLRFSSECFFILMLAAYLLAWTGMKETPWKYASMGAAAGLACGVRPTALLLLPAFGVFLLVRCACCRLFPGEPIRAGKSLRDYAVYAAAFLLLLSPLCIRNHINCGTWSPSGCLGGFNLFVGNNRDNALAYRASGGKEFLEHQNDGWDRAIAFAKAMPCDLPPAEQDRRFRAAALDEIGAMGAWEFCRMSAAKAWHFVRPWPLHGAHPEAVFWLICLFELALFAAGAAGIWILRKDRAFLLLLLMVLCVGWSAHTFVHLQMRHRVPFLDLPLVLLGGAAFGHMVRAVSIRLGRPVPGHGGNDAGI